MNVLVFDDSLFFIKILSASLKENAEDVKIFTSQTYEDAVKVVEQHDIDVAFIDLKMPGILNGPDFIVYLNSHTRFNGIRKVVLTETHPNSLLRKSYGKIVEEYLFKEDVFRNFDLILDQLNAKAQHLQRQ